MSKNYCIIMAGGVGARFWPMSKTSLPKQFIDILGSGETLIQQTYNRFIELCGKDNIFIVTNGRYQDLIKEQLEGINDDNILLEPMRKNTAPCIAYACYKIYSKDKDANIIVAPSDHIILKEQDFIDTAKIALNASKDNNCLITLGINPSRPDTGYGYIQYSDTILEKNDRVNKVVRFTEKPQLEKAKEFLNSGDFLWNAGIFIWSAATIIKAFNTYLPELDNLFAAGYESYYTDKEAEFINEIYPKCENISIDYAIMEKAKDVFVIKSDFGWSDLGTWGSLYDIRDKDSNSNSVIGDNVMLYDSKSCIINMPKQKLAVIQGLEDMIIVESEDVLLICKKSDEQKIRNFVDDVKDKKGENYV